MRPNLMFGVTCELSLSRIPVAAIIQFIASAGTATLNCIFDQRTVDPIRPTQPDHGIDPTTHVQLCAEW